jgi:hypothetical protein
MAVSPVGQEKQELQVLFYQAPAAGFFVKLNGDAL